jgi:SAM-dependent methyltransferase
MDDNTFDRETANDWINTVESEKARIRDRDIYPLLKAWVNSVAPAEILDIGAGQGVCSDHIDLDGRNYTGVDPSPFLVERAKKLYGFRNRQFIQGSAYALPFPANVFDAAFSIAVWHLLDNLQAATNELSRVLRENGGFLIITANPNAYTPWIELYADTRSDGRRLEGTVRHPDQSVSRDVLYLHTLDEITAALKAAHCRIEGLETFRTFEGSEGQGKFILIKGYKRPQSNVWW